MASKRYATLLTILLTLGLAGSALAQAAGPQLLLADPLKDFGTVAKGTKLEHTFSVRNTGASDLQILQVQPACGCTVADFDKVIKPGETGKIHAVVETAAFSGPISKGITVQSNDPNQPSAQLTMRAVVQPYVEAYPAGFLRYMMLQGQTRTQSVVLYSEEEKPFEIVKIESPADYIKVDYAKIENAEERPTVGREGQNQYKVNVTVGPNAKLGPLADKVKIITNSANQPEYQVSVVGLVRPSYLVNPGVVNFGEVSASDVAATRTISLKTNDREALDAFKVTKVESDNPAVQVEARPAGEPGTFEVTVRIDEKAKAGEFAGNLKIYTTDKFTPVYTVPVRGSVKG